MSLSVSKRWALGRVIALAVHNPMTLAAGRAAEALQMLRGFDIVLFAGTGLVQYPLDEEDDYTSYEKILPG